MIRWYVVVISFVAIANLSILSLVSWLKPSVNKANIWLGVLLLSVVLAMLSNVLIYIGLDCKWIYNLSIATNISAGGVFIELFSILQNKPVHGKVKHLLLFLPSILYIPILFYSLFDSEWIVQLLNAVRNGQTNLPNALSNLIICLYSIGANGWLLYREYTIKNDAIGRPRGLRTMRIELLVVMLIMQLCAFSPFLLKLDISFIILYMPVFGQLFYLYMTYRFLHFNWWNSESIAEERAEKYIKLNLRDDQIEQTYSRILLLMQEKKPYLQCNYMLQDLSRELKVSKNVLSMVINSKMQKSFSEYVNGMRIDYSIKLMKSNKMKEWTIEAVAFDSGFNNRTSFYQAFKKHTGKSPKEYLWSTATVQEE